MATVATIPPTTLSATEAAELLGVSRQTVNRMADADELPAIRVRPSSPRRFRTDDVEELRRRVYDEGSE